MMKHGEHPTSEDDATRDVRELQSAKRRRLLKWLGFGSAVAVCGGIAFKPARNWYRSLSLRLDAAPAGPLDDVTLSVLRSAAEALLSGFSTVPQHYADFMRWRAVNVPGYLALYRAFAAALDAAARGRAPAGYASAEPQTRRAILNEVAAVRSSRLPGPLERLRITVLARDRRMYDRYIVRELLELFARTEALALIGYRPWPGLPRGLDDYRQPPPPPAR